MLPIVIIYLVLFTILISRLFVLQIVQGQTHAQESEQKTAKSREIKSTRGNIYDRNGKLLATNALSYSIMLEDSTALETNEQKNSVIYQLIQIIEGYGDTLENEFYIKQNDQGEFEFTESGVALTRFKKNAYAFVLEDKELTESQVNATAEEVFDFLRYGTEDFTTMFNISDQYTIEEALKIMSVRYALFCNYPKYQQITVASNVSDTTVAAVMESSSTLLGVEVQRQAKRIYNDSLYFSHLLGYTGLINAEELSSYEAETDRYNSTDIIGKTGLEKEYESYLSGTKGSELVSTTTLGKVIEVVDRIDPTAGNDVYLTIDSDLQKACYHILEKKIAGILISRIVPTMDYGTKGESANDILTPIYEVYNALISNNVIDVKQFDDEDASALEQQVYEKYQTKLNDVMDQLDNLLAIDNTIVNNKAGEMEDYLDYFYSVLVDQDILSNSFSSTKQTDPNTLLTNFIQSDDTTYNAYRNNKISLSSFLQYAIANNWVDLSKLNIGTEYYIPEELYTKLITYTKDILKNDDSTFNKMIYRDLVFSYNLSGTEICLLLFDQGVLEYNKDNVNNLKSSSLSPFQFMRDKLISLEITPAMLALEPCSGSLVVTDVTNGDVLALVSYPSYDNNMLANKIDSAYYKKLMEDKALPLLNRPTQQRTAPGSTYKMLTAIAALEEKVVGPTDTVRDLGIFEKIIPSPKCYKFPSSHGSVDVANALKVSCNYFFYEMGYRLGLDSAGKYSEQLGIEKLAKYADLFGLNEKSGIELYEANPQVSNDDSVRSAIGQGTNDYTPVQLSRYVTTLANRGTCYDLTVLNKIVDKDGKILLKNNAKVFKDLTSISDSTWDTVQRGMYYVVNAPGGSVNPIFQNFEIEVAGKTGTAQKSKVNPNHALFVSYAPFDKPKISVTAVIPNGHTSKYAAELGRDVYKYYFKLKDYSALVEGGVTLPESESAAFSD